MDTKSDWTGTRLRTWIVASSSLAVSTLVSVAQVEERDPVKIEVGAHYSTDTPFIQPTCNGGTLACQARLSGFDSRRLGHFAANSNRTKRVYRSSGGPNGPVIQYGPLAQREEQVPLKDKVPGAWPGGSTIS